jgi:hypothetical protein
VAASVWRLKMTKGNWVDGPNVWLGRTGRRKNMAESMRWARKIEE